ncbi:MAG: 16S rRNA (guanine(527)-N(7))-methyltransferase RsmG [Spirochaetota bacterium]|nr:16S rRNA (guanine(527)-N(7))-methyltransferase RsmG [Spirochaetota bacterium]
MEQGVIETWAEGRGLRLDPSTKERLYGYVELVHETNKRFNITGIRDKGGIMETLVIGSLDPFVGTSVLRGTSFVDIGSGAGVPGVPISILVEGSSGLLVESNQKKADFIASVVADLGLSNLEVVCQRVEGVARDEGRREAFDWILSRAFGSAYIATEVAASLLRVNGCFYLYSKEGDRALDTETLSHAKDLGLSLLLPEKAGLVVTSGILLRKFKPTPQAFPRRFATIKRDSRRLNVRSDHA